MDKNKYWFKFIVSGNPQDYLKYKEYAKMQQISGGESSAYYNGRPCNKRNEYKG